MADLAPIQRPRAGELLHITRAASVQFVHPFLFRVIRTLDRDTYHGWAWIDGYQLNAAGDAERRRELYVQLAGLRRAAEQPRARAAPARNGSPAAARAARRPRNPAQESRQVLLDKTARPEILDA